MRIRKTAQMILLLLLCLTLAGCRTRTTDSAPETGEVQNAESEAVQPSASRSRPDGQTDSPEAPDEQKKNGEPGDRTKENPEASRKEYDEQAPAEIVPGTERTVQGEGEGTGASSAREDAEETAVMLNEAAEKTAVQTVAAEQAEQLGVSEDAEEADSIAVYYSVLLQDRTRSLFECQRRNVYWETAEDHVTVFNTSAEHAMILNAGAYDVSARLLEQNLRVDDGWIGRKNPEVIVKITGSGVLGTGVFSSAAAQQMYEGLLARDGWASIDAVRNGRVLLISEELLATPELRVAAMLMIARTANPELFPDLEIGKALDILMEETTGSIPAGLYYYTEQGGF